MPARKKRRAVRSVHNTTSPTAIIADISTASRAQSPTRTESAPHTPGRLTPTRVIADALVRQPHGPTRFETEAPPPPTRDRRQIPELAFWGIWSEHMEHLRRHSLRWMSNNTADAEDALSSAMLLAHRKYPEHAASIANTRAWLTRLVYNVCMDHHRVRDRFASLSNEETVAADTPSIHSQEIPEPDRQATTDETLDLLQKAVADLSPSLRDPLILRCIYDRSYAEIAERLGIAESAVRKRVQLARDKLRQVIGPRN